MSLNSLLKTNTEIILFGGKGGVGKTSISSATALYFAEKGEKVLIISTDPAHSLSDSFSQNLSGGEIIRITDVKGELYGLEINPEKGTKEMKEILESKEELDGFQQSLEMLGFEDITSDLTRNTPPGMDEAISLAKVMEIARQSTYDRIILDTAPTGHTIRLLALPEFLDSFLGKLMKLRVKLNNTMAMFKSFLGMDAQKDHSLELMEKLKENIIRIRDDLQNNEKTEFVVVTIPTLMAVYESERLLSSLHDQQILVRNVVINQINPKNESCPFCMARYNNQKKVIDYAEAIFSEYYLTKIPFFPEEIKGVEELRKLALVLFEENS